MKDEDFFKAYERHQNETVGDYIARNSATDAELRDTISFLIHHRELIRDSELEVLEAETNRILEKLDTVKRRRLMEEVGCFKDVLQLHKRLVSEDGKSRD